eukprot:365990-Chlamydomonas_euryale.AAC.34
MQSQLSKQKGPSLLACDAGFPSADAAFNHWHNDMQDKAQPSLQTMPSMIAVSSWMGIAWFAGRLWSHGSRLRRGTHIFIC